MHLQNIFYMINNQLYVMYIMYIMYIYVHFLERTFWCDVLKLFFVPTEILSQRRNWWAFSWNVGPKKLRSLFRRSMELLHGLLSPSVRPFRMDSMKIGFHREATRSKTLSVRPKLVTMNQMMMTVMRNGKRLQMFRTQDVGIGGQE